MNNIEDRLTDLYEKEGDLRVKKIDLEYKIRRIQTQIQILEEEYNNSRQQKMF
tara:strand:- start:906 stop:1064 length:159 start_codon:yes stop_codon:yes gene_type:complete